MNKLEQFALQMLKNNPRVSQTPLGQEFMNVLQSGNAARGQELANNLCQTYGTPPEKAVEIAKEYFHL